MGPAASSRGSLTKYNAMTCCFTQAQPQEDGSWTSGPVSCLVQVSCSFAQPVERNMVDFTSLGATAKVHLLQVHGARSQYHLLLPRDSSRRRQIPRSGLGGTAQQCTRSSCSSKLRSSSGCPHRPHRNGHRSVALLSSSSCSHSSFSRRSLHMRRAQPVPYTHLRAHGARLNLVCRFPPGKKKTCSVKVRKRDIRQKDQMTKPIALHTAM